MDKKYDDLVFNVAQLLKEPVGAKRNLDLEANLLLLDEQAEDGLLGAHDVKGAARATRLNKGVLVQGEVNADVVVECSRCLEHFSTPVDGTLEEQFNPAIDVDTGLPMRLADYEADDTIFQIDANHLMDLSEPVRQALLVALPMKPLCREDCAGLCVECGANRNDVDCGHTNESVDHRWEGLQVLRLEDFPAGENLN